MSGNVISVVAALIRDEDGRVLLVRKRGTAVFMQPGGKRDPGESDIAALARELVEELGCHVAESSARPLGVFECAAANEPGHRVRAAVYAVDVEGPVIPRAEIDQLLWVDPRALPRLAFGSADARPCAAIGRRRVPMNSGMKTMEGGCHCGRVRFRVTAELDRVTYCNCSMCTKKGFLHLIVPPEQFELLSGKDDLATYTFNTGVAKHTFCRRCGIHPFYVPRSDPDKIDVNVRCLDSIDLSALSVRSFDGQHWEQAMQKDVPWR